MPVCTNAYPTAALAPNSLADAAIAETQGEHAMINTVKATAHAALIAAERSVP